MSNQSNYCADYIDKSDQDILGQPEFVKALIESPKFRLPNEGVLIPIGLGSNDNTSPKEVFENYVSELRLPYEVVVFEFMYLGQKVILLARDNSYSKKEGVVEGITFTVATQARIDDDMQWVRVTANVFIGLDFSVKIYPQKENDFQKVQDLTPENISWFSGMAYAVVCFIAAVQCSNVATSSQEPPLKLNKSRQKKGKTPFFTYKVLTIDTKADNSDRSTSERGKERGTKRSHLRRGHIRRLENKTIWVNPCVVGNSKLGRVDKDYKVI